MSNFTKKLHDAVFVDDSGSKKHEAPAAAPPAPSIGFNSAMKQQPQPWPAAPAPAMIDNPDVYNQIHIKTDFEQTVAGQTLQKYLVPLASIPMDQTQKFKVALAQATAQEGLTADKVLSTFEGLLVALQNEAQGFNDFVAQQTDHEVTQRNSQIAAITAQIMQLQQQQQQLSTDLVNAQSKISVATNQFSMASSRRKIELEQQKAQYAAMLKG